jgi:hypothetical protein
MISSSCDNERSSHGPSTTQPARKNRAQEKAGCSGRDDSVCFARGVFRAIKNVRLPILVRRQGVVKPCRLFPTSARYQIFREAKLLTLSRICKRRGMTYQSHPAWSGFAGKLFNVLCFIHQVENDALATN